MKRLGIAAVALAFVVLNSPVRADDKPNPTGTWKWTVSRGGQEREVTLKLKAEGDKLTGAMVGRQQETPIEDAKYDSKTGEFSFKVVRERDGQKFTSNYKGKVSGDTIKGKIEFERNGETQSRDWEAKRAKS
jgi:hypothetical protein